MGTCDKQSSGILRNIAQMLAVFPSTQPASTVAARMRCHFVNIADSNPPAPTIAAASLPSDKTPDACSPIRARTAAGATCTALGSPSPPNPRSSAPPNRSARNAGMSACRAATTLGAELRKAIRATTRHASGLDIGLWSARAPGDCSLAVSSSASGAWAHVQPDPAQNFLLYITILMILIIFTRKSLKVHGDRVSRSYAPSLRRAPPGCIANERLARVSTMLQACPHVPCKAVSIRSCSHSSSRCLGSALQRRPAKQVTRARTLGRCTRAGGPEVTATTAVTSGCTGVSSQETALRGQRQQRGARQRPALQRG